MSMMGEVTRTLFTDERVITVVRVVGIANTSYTRLSHYRAAPTIVIEPMEETYRASTRTRGTRVRAYPDDRY